MITGVFEVSLTDKQRLVLPQKLRTALKVKQGEAVFLGSGEARFAAVYSGETITVLTEQFKPFLSVEADYEAYRRLFYSQLEELQLDQQGRILLPAHTLTLLAPGYTKSKQPLNFTWVGVGTHVELWLSAVWSLELEKLRKTAGETNNRLGFIYRSWLRQNAKST